MSVWRSSLARASSSSASGLRLAPASSSSSRTFASSLACSLPRASSFSSPPTPQRQPAPSSSSSQPAQPSYFDYVVPQGRSRKAPSSQEHVVAPRAGKGTKADETALLAGDVKVDVPGSESQSRTEVEVESSRGDRAKFQKWNRNHLFVRHLPHGVDNASLKQAFEGAGLTVKNARVLAFPRRDGRFISRGYGWVALEHESEMKKGMRLDGMKINDIPIRIEQMKQRPQGSYDRPPPPEPIQAPGYHLRLPPRDSHSRRPQLIDDRPVLSQNQINAKLRLDKRQARKKFGPRPGEKESQVDWETWGEGTGRRGRIEEAEEVGWNRS